MPHRLLSEGERLGAGTGPTSRNGSGTPGPGRGVPAKHRLDEITTRIGATYRVGDSEAQKELLAWPRIREDLEWLVKILYQGGAIPAEEMGEGDSMRTKATWQEESLVWMRAAREEAVQDMRRAELEIDALKRIVASLDQLIPMREAEAASAVKGGQNSLLATSRPSRTAATS